MTNSIKWGVVTTVSEPLPLVLAFVHHHLSLGADFIHIYLDTANEPALRTLSDIDNCTVVNCDENYWQESLIGKRPEDHRDRQIYNANYSYSEIDCDWLIHLDADEFLFSSNEVKTALSKEDPNITALRIKNYERVFLKNEPVDSIFDGVARKAIPSVISQISRIYGPYRKYLTYGMGGHIKGKSFVRTNMDLTLHIHAPRGKVDTSWSDSIHIVHFDGVTKRHWIKKIYSKILSSKDGEGHNRSRARSNLINYAKGDGLVYEKMARLHNSTYVLSKWQYALLKKFNLVTTFYIDIDSLKELYKVDGLAFTCSEFDSFLADSLSRVEYRGLLMDVSLLSNFTERLIALTGKTREEQEMDWLCKNLSVCSKVIIDVGANAGIYSLVLASICKASQVYAVECNPVMLKRLRQNCRINNLDNINVIDYAVSDCKGKSVLKIPSVGNLGQGTLENKIVDRCIDEITVETIPLHTLCSELGLEEIDFLKLDIEGHEPVVMEAFFKNSDERLHPKYVLIEMKHNESDIDGLYRLMESMGYAVAFETKNNKIFCKPR